MKPYRIILADDHALLRQGLRRIIGESDGLQVIGEAADGVELLRLMNKMTPDMVVLDISMPNLRGLEAIGEIKCRHAEVKVLVLTMHRDKDYLYQALSSGADGYLLKDDADTELFAAIGRIRDGRLYVSPSLARELTDYRAHFGRKEVLCLADREVLTNREREVLKLIAEGKSSREIADLLFISVRTVDHHRANIMEKLKLRKAADLVKYAVSKGYV